tara:strand:+ start:707 stop:1204 length:498 start_codon:yes stop_codon:yes gene_type:complete
MKKKVKIYNTEIKRSVRRGLMENLVEQWEMKDTYSRAGYKQGPKEKEIEGVFGQYGEDIPPAVLRYMRKNPKAIIKRLYDVYGQQMFDYISDNYEGGEVDIEVSDEIVVDEALLNVGNEKEAVDAEKAGFEGTIQIKKDLGESKKIKSITGKEISKLFISKSKNK